MREDIANRELEPLQQNILHYQSKIIPNFFVDFLIEIKSSLPKQGGF